jgi:hypothetical protein
MLSSGECWIEKAPLFEPTHGGGLSEAWIKCLLAGRGPIPGGNVPSLSAIWAGRSAGKAAN